MKSNYFRKYIAGYIVANLDVIQSNVVLQKQVHKNYHELLWVQYRSW